MKSGNFSLGKSRNWGKGFLLSIFSLTTLCLALAGLVFGPVQIGLPQILLVFLDNGTAATDAIIVQIRAPRVVLGAAVGAGLALSGVALQGILRNPLADPGLIGITAGAAAGAVFVIVLGQLIMNELPMTIRPYLLPISAFIGAALVTAFVFSIARRSGHTSVTTLILGGVAINAIAGAGIGGMIYISDDQQLRDLTFWSMGGLGQADWPSCLVAIICILAAGVGLFSIAKSLDLFQLGEGAAFHTGVDVEKTKIKAAVWSALAVGVGTAVAGPIGFIGLVAPHIARLFVGPMHRFVAPSAALIGASLLLAADLAVRTTIPPAEPPVGLATSLIGGPFFLYLLIRTLDRK